VIARTLGKPLSETGDGCLENMSVFFMVLRPPHFAEEMPVGDYSADAAGEQEEKMVTVESGGQYRI
jgi:hypothetical protein